MLISLAALGAVVLIGGCKFPYPADVPDDDVERDASAGAHTLGGRVTGLWTGAAITVHLVSGDLVEDVVATPTEPFEFAARLVDDARYLVTIADDGPDHDCVVQNGNGQINGSDVSNLAVSCTNLVPHGLAISLPEAFVFDPRTTRYVIPVSLVQQEATVVVTGPTLTAVTVNGIPVTVGQPSAPAAIGPQDTTVEVVVTKGPISQRYELVFDRGGIPMVEALYGRASNAGLGDRFGGAAAASGDYVAVGAPLEDSSSTAGADDAVTNSGAVYIYRRSGATWTQTQILKGTTITTERWFGYAVDMDGPVLVVGAANDDGRGQDAGAVYVFRLDPGSGRWNEEQRLTASDPHMTDRFGSRVAVSGDLLVVCAPGHDAGGAGNSNFGLVYVFARSGGTWTEEARVRQPAPQTGDQFGSTLSLDADTLVAQTTRVLVVMRRNGATWFQEAVPAAAVGSDVDVQGDLLVVGQPADPSGTGQPGDQSAPNAGAVRVYSRNGPAWSEAAYLKAASPQAGAQVGAGVALRGNTIATAARGQGAVLTFHRVGGSWIVGDRIVASGPPTDLASWGTAVALSRNGAVVTYDNDNGVGPGAATVSGTAWFFR